jgi:Zn-dependent metalloprotease
VVVILKKYHENRATTRHLIGDTFFKPSEVIFGQALRDAKNPGNAWRYVHPTTGELKRDRAIAHIDDMLKATTFYDISTILSRALFTLIQTIGHVEAGQIWWEAIKFLSELRNSNGGSDLQYTIGEFAIKTFIVACKGKRNYKNPIR